MTSVEYKAVKGLVKAYLSAPTKEDGHRALVERLKIRKSIGMVLAGTGFDESVWWLAVDATESILNHGTAMLPSRLIAEFAEMTMEQRRNVVKALWMLEQNDILKAALSQYFLALIETHSGQQ